MWHSLSGDRHNSTITQSKIMTIKPQTIPGLRDFLESQFTRVSYDQGIAVFTMPNSTVFLQANPEFLSNLQSPSREY